MERGITGTYDTSVAAGESCRSFVLAPLPSAPALAVDTAKALGALGEQDARRQD